MTADDRSPCGDEASEGGGEFQERRVNRLGADVCERIDPHHPSLELGDFGKRAVDRIFDGTDLGSNFESGVFKHLFAHDGSFPGAARRSDCRSDLKVGSG
jgi:hypothetical protein